ncbi:uncharacterized protein RMCT_1182 [Mycolicibacterium thermoresistibile]|uniref:Uncharacterized protein n=1 Tax=Mycolicibacterium thermoresistibile TaxID=1797 RepID=A0A124E806_MYCTH|nr:uncharacterized protein RMCT_1182 [Mycolicibacterium thermoresistibile]
MLDEHAEAVIRAGIATSAATSAAAAFARRLIQLIIRRPLNVRTGGALSRHGDDAGRRIRGFTLAPQRWGGCRFTVTQPIRLSDKHVHALDGRAGGPGTVGSRPRRNRRTQSADKVDPGRPPGDGSIEVSPGCMSG